MKFDKLATNHGFTLVETLASLAVFALCSAAIGELLVAQIHMENSNAFGTTAISLAAKELEDLRSLDYPSIPATRTSTATVGGLTYTVTSTAAFDQPNAGMATITTTISWTEPLGAKSYAVNAIYTDVTR